MNKTSIVSLNSFLLIFFLSGSLPSLCLHANILPPKCDLWIFFLGGGPSFSSRHGPSNIFDFTAVAAAETHSQSQKKKWGGGGGERMRPGDRRRSGSSVIYI